MTKKSLKKSLFNNRDKHCRTVQVYFSEKEYAALEEFRCRKGSTSMSALVRECAVRFVMGHIIEEDSRLFDESGRPTVELSVESLTPRPVVDNSSPTLFDFGTNNNT